MTRPLDADRVLEDWLAEGPSRLPDRAIDGIVRQLQDTPQRGSRWIPRRDRMNRLFLSVGGAAAALLVAVVGFVHLYGGGPAPVPGESPTPVTIDSPEPSPEPSEAPEPVTFTSERHGYSILLPDDGWIVIERPGEWAPDTMFGQESPGVDYILAPGGPIGDYRHELFLNSQPIPEESTYEDWLADYDLRGGRTFGYECRLQPPYAAGTVDGRPVRLSNFVCGGQRWAEAMWEHAGRAYSLRFGEIFDSPIRAESPQAELEVWLSRITLED
jgi:hypothetical protein